ncbi:AAA+ ATPase domain-containing protein [[Candida] zeylanoides]
MSLWVDKYRPRQLDQLSYHPEITAKLRALASTGDFPHLLVYGPTGSGKKTRIYATLHELFGPSIEKLKIDVKTFTTSSNRKLEFNVLSSPYHLEITPSDMGNNDRVVIQDLLKDVASTEQVDFTNSNHGHAKHRFKVVIINEADSLSRDAQAALRRTMEKYSSNIRLIMISNTTSNIIAPIKSRTLLIRIPAPSKQEIATVLQHISNKEQVKYTSDSGVEAFLQSVAQNCDRNLRKSMLCFETIAMQNESINPSSSQDSAVVKLDWEVIIEQMGKSILANRTVANLAKVRVVFYELLAHCIPARVILKKLLFCLIDGVSRNELVRDLVAVGSQFDERLSLGQKSIFHLEGFAARAMVVVEGN